MLQDVISHLEWGFWAALSLVIFFITFVAILIWTLLQPRRTMDRHSQIAIRDDVVEPRDTIVDSKPEEPDHDG